MRGILLHQPIVYKVHILFRVHNPQTGERRDHLSEVEGIGFVFVEVQECFRFQIFKLGCSGSSYFGGQSICKKKERETKSERSTSEPQKSS